MTENLLFFFDLSISFQTLQSLEEFNFSSEHFFKFILVRHPLDRLYSCYRDKMITNKVGYEGNWKDHRVTIAPLPQHKSLQKFRATVKKRSRLNGTDIDPTIVNQILEPKPTLEEFVRFILDTDMSGKVAMFKVLEDFSCNFSPF